MAPLRIGIVSRNANLVSTRRLMLAIRRRGHIVRLVDPMGTHFDIAGSTGILSDGQRLPRLDGVIPRVGVQSASYVLALIQQMETMGIVCLNRTQNMAIARDKLRTLQCLTQSQLPIPKTVYGSFTVSSASLIEAAGGVPLIIKTLDGSQGVGVMLAHTQSQAESIMDVLKQAHIEFIIQEYLAESKGHDVRCFVIGDQVVASMQRQSGEGEFRSNLHRGGIAVPYALSEGERALALDAAHAVGLSVAGVDMIHSYDGPKVIEVNCSPGLEGIENTVNLDIAGMIVDYLIMQIIGKG